MKILFAINHPAQYHLFKNVYAILGNKGHDIVYVIKDKDILENLLISEEKYYIKLTKKRVGKGKVGIIFNGFIDLIIQDFYLLKYCLKNRPHLMIGTDYCITHIGKLLKIPSFVFNEDDFNINKFFCKLAYPLSRAIIAPMVCDVGKYTQKKIGYSGYQKLSYLHPNVFTPSSLIVKKYFILNEPFVIIRLVRFAAGHDIEKKHSGITSDLLQKIITKIESVNRNVFISSESKIPRAFSKYELKIDTKDIHHIMAFSDLFIADSQSMIVEAAMLGVPSIRFNSFVGHISVLNELEEKYKLTYGIPVNNPELLLSKIDQLLSIDNLKEEFQSRKTEMLNDKIDVTAFIVWFIENYPASEKIMRKDPDYQYNFK